MVTTFSSFRLPETKSAYLKIPIVSLFPEAVFRLRETGQQFWDAFAPGLFILYCAAVVLMIIMRNPLEAVLDVGSGLAWISYLLETFEIAHLTGNFIANRVKDCVWRR